MERNISRFIKVYPWYVGFTSDLLFYIAIDTLFLTLVKHFSPAEIVSLASVSQLACIALQFPLLFVIRKIGNTASMRVGAILLLLSAIFITFGKVYFLVLIGRILHDASIIFKSASIVALENNLETVDRRDEFIRVRTSGNTVYSIITMLISFVVSYMFNLNNYLPMLCCIAACAVGVALSMMMRDFSDYNKIPHERRSRERVKVRYGGLIIITVIAYSVFYLIVTNGQSEGKLFIQQNLLESFDVEATALIIGAVVCVSRIVRVLSNIVFARLYKRYKSGMGIILSVLLSLSIAFLLFGSFIPLVLVKIVVMSLGYTVILFARDPFKLYIQDVIFEHTDKSQHQTLLTTMEFGVKIVGAGVGLCFSAVLLGYPLVTVMWIMFAITVIELILNIGICRSVISARKAKICQAD